MARRANIRTKRMQKKFLVELEERGNVQEACDVLNLARSSVYLIRDDDAAFALLWKHAEDSHLDKAAKECYERAMNGTEEIHVEIIEKADGTKITKKKKIKKVSDSLLQFLLERRHPDFKKKEEVDVTVRPGVLKTTPLAPDEWEEMVKDLADQHGGTLIEHEG